MVHSTEGALVSWTEDGKVRKGDLHISSPSHTGHHPHSLLARHLYTVRLRCHTIRINVTMALNEHVHIRASDALSRADGTITVS